MNRQEKIAKETKTLDSNPISVKSGCMILGMPYNLSVPQLLYLSKNPIVCSKVFKSPNTFIFANLTRETFYFSESACP